MMRTSLLLAAVLSLCAAGCCGDGGRKNCDSGCAACGDPARGGAYAGGPGYGGGPGGGMGGPPTAAVAYPYYTNRGPRDFLAKNPGDIGP